MPFTGIGTTPVVIGLVAYALLILISNAVVGLPVASPARLRGGRAAWASRPGRRSCGWSSRWPCPRSWPGIRIATVSTVGIATIGAFVGAGGLGELIYQQGIQRGLFVTPIVVGAVVATAMAIALDLALWGSSGP